MSSDSTPRLNSIVEDENVATTKGGGLKDFAAGGFGGICQLVVGHPLDTVKVKLQAGGAYKGLGDVIQQTLKKDGVSGFYRGVSSPLVGFTALNAVLFATYGIGNQIASNIFQTQAERNSGELIPLKGVLLAGGFAGIFAAFVECPMDLFKAKMQAQVPRPDGTVQYKNTFDCVRQISQNHGIRGVYQGIVPTLARNICCNATYFLGYEWTKRTFAPEGNPGPGVLLMAGGIAGVSYWILYPLDIIKTLIQTDHSEKSQRTYRGYLDCAQKLYARSGVRGFFVGFTPCILRAFPANAACFYGYEYAKKFLS